MPKPPTDQDPDVEISLPQGSDGQRLPVFEGVKVVYLGNKRNKNVPLRGKVAVETLGEGDDLVTTRRPITTGFTSYDFATHNDAGKPIPAKFFMPANHPDPVVRGKRFRVVEHPDHLWAFQASETLYEGGEHVFKLLGPPSQMSILQEFFAAKLRAANRAKHDYGLISARG